MPPAFLLRRLRAKRKPCGMVNTQHPQYLAASLKWTRARDVTGGEDRVKTAGEVYLPKLSDQTPEEYAAYRDRALFFNATSRTVEAFTGMIFRKDPTEEFPAELEDFRADANLHGQSFFDYEKAIVREVLTVGRAGTLVDWSDDEQRPYVVRYEAEQILNWRTGRVGGKTVLTLVVLKESVDIDEARRLESKATAATGKAPEAARPVKGFNTKKETGPVEDSANDSFFKQNTKEQIRVLRLDQTTATPVYTVDIWRKDAAGKFARVLTVTPQRKGSIALIPFVFHGPNNLLPDVDRPPIDDIAVINLSHYRSSADLEHGRHFTGLPTAFAAGFDANKTYKIGSAAAWVSTDVQAKASYLEFTGQGLDCLVKALEQKEQQMAVLGARMLQQEKKVAETENTALLRTTGEQASLSQIAITASESFAMIYRLALWWKSAADSTLEDAGGKVKVELNTDFNPTQMQPALVSALVSAAQQGYLSKDSVVTQLKRGELIGGNRSVEDELKLIEETMPDLNGDPADLDKKRDAKSKTK